MPQFKRLRQQRFNDLRLLGLLDFEAKELSKQPKSVWDKAPYFKAMAQARYDEFRRWLKAGKTPKAWVTHILIRYNQKNWAGKYGAKKRSPTAVYNMVEPWKQAYKAKHPEYQSPKELRKRDYSSHDAAMKRWRQIHKKLPPGGDKRLDR